MSVEREEERTLEVLRLAPHVDQELLALYFENRRRSGGGPLVSVEQRGDRATLVFEEAEGEFPTTTSPLGVSTSLRMEGGVKNHLSA